YLGNTPSRPLQAPPVGRARLYERLGLEENVRAVAEFAMQAPGEFAHGLWRKVLYTCGFFGASRLPGGIGTSWWYVAVWALAFAGIWRMLAAWRPDWKPVVWLPVTGALTHAAAVILIFP